jgi:uncharacterized iron-regulated membrane protein
LLDPLVLRERLLTARPHVVAQASWLHAKPGQSVWFFVEPLPGAPELANDQIFMNPYTGEVLGERKAGDLTQGIKNLMVFVYRLHYALALGQLGLVLMGIVAVTWTVDCFIGAWLTLPVRPPARKPAKAARHTSWWSRWAPAWQLRWASGSYKLTFDLHRAGGLWLWAALFILAWSSVCFNLPQVYNPVMQTLLSHQPSLKDIPALASPRPDPALDFEQAREVGRRLMAAEAARHGFTVLREDWLAHNPSSGLYQYEVLSSLDLGQRSGQTQLAFDSNTGTFKALWLPTHAASGDTIYTWITNLHMASFGGVPMKLLVCAMGVVVAMLSVTGIVIWAKKRASRKLVASRRPSRPA